MLDPIAHPEAWEKTKQQAVELRSRLNNEFGLMECRKQLVIADGDIDRAYNTLKYTPPDRLGILVSRKR